MIKKLTVNIEGKETHDLVFALEEVKRKVEEEYTSGFDSNEDGRYNFDVSDMTEEEEINGLPMKACEAMKKILGKERCDECHCHVAEDWDFAEFSNKTIIVCPECGQHYEVE